jgi:hypothetical protein
LRTFTARTLRLPYFNLSVMSYQNEVYP